MFWRRTLSVVLLMPLVLLIIYLGSWLFLILVTAAVLMMQVEYCRLAHQLTEKINPVIPVILTVAFAFLAFFLPNPLQDLKASMWMQTSLVVVLIYAFASSLSRGQVAGELVTVTLKLTGIITIGWAFAYHTILLRNVNDIGMQLIILLIGTIWCGDTGAYLIGRAIGKHKLITPISPRKTIEGTIAGLVVGILVSILLCTFILQDTLSLLHAAIVGLVLSVFGQLGDLSVSLMKRTVGVKDSGDYIPGHGGLLDRCDSLMFCAPILYYYLTLTGIIH
ncbi:hypothetical protein C6497_17740 [Candidatus Poribacteria bacterium]|nr:MAG: hypothetical protein C6497_17740 [Candidatus Poribacteria bacterium]